MAIDGITVTGRYNAERTMAVISHNLRHSELSAPRVWEYLEDKYEIAFDHWFPEMYDTGLTRESLTERHGEKAIRGRWKGIQFGTEVWYARFHERRLFGVITQQVEDEIADILADHFVPPERIGTAGVVTGYYATRHTGAGPRNVYVRPHIRGDT